MRILLLLTALLSAGGCHKRTPSLFSELSAAKTNISFANQLSETPDFNIIEYLYFYNGAGAGLADFNQDGQLDIYLVSNQQANRLYINQGNWRFADVTETAGVTGIGNWKTGVTLADVNGDGWMDIFLTGVGNYKKFTGQNQLLINNKDLTFSDYTEPSGLAFKGFSTHAAFFDYDRDGDLDMYLVNHSVHTPRSYGKKSLRYQADSLAGDRLYRNELVPSGSLSFTDVTREAGILSSQIGYGLAVASSDINNDGYPDIYVSNDFHENDYLYINQGNGIFKQELEKSMPHTSRFSMGTEVADFNNDGWQDILTLDMLPFDEPVIKTSAGEDTYEVYRFKLQYGYHPQVARNTLQLNHGLDSGRLFFSDVALAAGVAATDWSWGALLADFDGDARKDILITNGIVRRPNDMDFVSFIATDSAQRLMDKNALPWVEKMPQGRVANRFFRNTGDFSFELANDKWFNALPGFSNGAAYGDLDNDGDLDLVINNINDKATLLKNNSKQSFRSVRLVDPLSKGNVFALGARVEVVADSVTQTFEVQSNRGWCSSSSTDISFVASGNFKLQVRWPDGMVQEEPGTSEKIWIVEKKPGMPPLAAAKSSNATFQPFDAGMGQPHHENYFNAFSRESLIPHMLTTEGPPLAVADFDRDGLDDVYAGGGRGQAGLLYRQLTSGRFESVTVPAFNQDTVAEDVAAVWVDVDNDGDSDLLVAGGGHENIKAGRGLRVRLYQNNRGKLEDATNRLPEIFLNASCLRPADFDGDGDVDLFVGASVMPYLYGMSPASYLWVNDGTGRFRDEPGWLGRSRFDNPNPLRPGMVKDAAWADVNRDGRLDLLLVGEWMPIMLLVQQPDKSFLNVTNQYGLHTTNGWWNAIEPADLDGDGFTDFVVGNLGLNSRFTASQKKPLQLMLGDFDANGSSDHILIYYNGEKNYPFATRDDLVKQLPTLKKKYLHYYDYQHVQLDDLVPPEQKNQSARLSINMLQSVVLWNEPGRLKLQALPVEAQLFPVMAIATADVSGDKNPEILLGGNLLATQPAIGPYDAGYGLMVQNSNARKLTAYLPRESGWVLKGEVRDIKVLQSARGPLFVVSRNGRSPQAFIRSGSQL